MTRNGNPEYTSTTGEFRAEDITPFIGRKVVVALTPVPNTGFAAESTVAAGIMAGAFRDRNAQPGLSPVIYFEQGFKITVDLSEADTVLTIALIGVNGRV